MLCFLDGLLLFSQLRLHHRNLSICSVDSFLGLLIFGLENLHLLFVAAVLLHELVQSCLLFSNRGLDFSVDLVDLIQFVNSSSFL